MVYVNVGVYTDGQRLRSKRQLKEMVKESPELLRFDQTSTVAGLPLFISLKGLPDHVILSVTGPDPYNNRKWYANVQRKNGNLVVS